MKTIEETYNIHKNLWCMFPKFKSKWLCKHGKHNFQLQRRKSRIAEFTIYGLKYKTYDETIWKCRCCGIEELYDEETY